MGLFTNIDAALNTKLKSTTSVFIEWPNTKKTVTNHDTYIRPTNMPASSKLETLAGSTRHTGIYQIDIFCPLDEGTYTLTNLMDDITNSFESDRDLIAGSNTIRIQEVTRGIAERQESWWVGFISINYICYS